MKIKVSNLPSDRSNRPIANQFEIQVINEETGASEIYFQSYNTIIALKSKGKRFLDKYDWNYSRTTSKYRNIFFGETTKETEAKIKSGEYILTDLN